MKALQDPKQTDQALVSFLYDLMQSIPQAFVENLIERSVTRVNADVVTIRYPQLASTAQRLAAMMQPKDTHTDDNTGITITPATIPRPNVEPHR